MSTIINEVCYIPDTILNKYYIYSYEVWTGRGVQD